MEQLEERKIVGRTNPYNITGRKIGEFVFMIVGLAAIAYYLLTVEHGNIVINRILGIMVILIDLFYAFVLIGGSIVKTLYKRGKITL